MRIIRAVALVGLLMLLAATSTLAESMTQTPGNRAATATPLVPVATATRPIHTPTRAAEASVPLPTTEAAGAPGIRIDPSSVRPAPGSAALPVPPNSRALLDTTS